MIILKRQLITEEEEISINEATEYRELPRHQGVSENLIPKAIVSYMFSVKFPQVSTILQVCSLN